MITLKRHQQGAALIVGLMLLVVITVLAVSGMNTATTELAMARNDQNYENAFQAAETGLEEALSQGVYAASPTAITISKTINPNDSVSASIAYQNSTIVPDAAFSLGVGTGISAYHFLATSTASSKRSTSGDTDRDSTALHSQAFYVVGPGAPTL